MDEEFFEPLEDLDIGNAELILGLVHFTDGLTGTRQRMMVADRFVPHYGIATECGFGRRPAETIPELLRVHVSAVEDTELS